MEKEVTPGRGDIERRTTRGGKEAIFVRAEIVRDNPNKYTLFLGNVVAPIAFKRDEHKAFERFEEIFNS